MYPVSAPGQQHGRIRSGWLVPLLLVAIGSAVLVWASLTPGSPALTAWNGLKQAIGLSASGGSDTRTGVPESGQADGKPRGAGARTTPVTVAQVVRRDIRITLDALGTVSARASATVRAKVEGELLRLHFADGQRVKAGDLLAEIDASALKIALVQSQAALARDTGLLENARRDLARFRGLLAKDAIARQQVDNQQALVAQLEAGVRVGSAQVQSARLQLSYTRITAPISGVIGLRRIDAGNRVRAADVDGLATIVQFQPVDVLFSIPEAQLPAIRRRMAAGVAVQVDLFDRDFQQRLGHGVLSSLDNVIDPGSGSIRAKAAFANADRALFPNQFVNVRLHLDTRSNVLAAPSAALVPAARGATLNLVSDDMKLRTVAVMPGARDGDWIEISGDLKPGDRVVLDGAERVAAGARVRVVEPENAVRDERPAWVRRLPDDQALEVMKLPPAERRAWMVARIDERIMQAEALFAAGKRPDWWSRVSPEGQERLLALTPEQRMGWMRERAIARSGLDDKP